jgi:uncharacterized membrane protein YsdA (DUF1294 family)
MTFAALLYLTILVLILNLGTFFLFFYDKQCAINQNRRVSEAMLLQTTFLGGSIGAIAACIIFRHKTRKQPFAKNLFYILVGHIVLSGGALGWFAA